MRDGAGVLQRFLQDPRSLAQGSANDPLRAVRERLAAAFTRYEQSGGRVHFALSLHARRPPKVSHRSNVLLDVKASESLLVSITALDLLGPEFRFRTDYGIAGRYRDGVLYGDLVVLVRGDPTLTDVRVRQAVRSIQLAGLQRITHGIIVDDSLFNQGGVRPVVREDTPDAAHLVQPLSTTSESATIFEGNRVTIHIFPARVGSLARVEVVPPGGGVRLLGTIDTARFTRGPYAVPFASRRTSGVLLSGTVSPARGARRLVRPMAHPAQFLGRVVRQHLLDSGVRVPDRIAVSTEGVKTLPFINDFSSYITEIITALLHANTLGPPSLTQDSLLRTLAVRAVEETERVPATLSRGWAVVAAFLNDRVGLVDVKATWSRTSSRQLSADQLARALAYAGHDFEFAVEFLRALGSLGSHPVLALRLSEGTARRMRGLSAAAGDQHLLAGYAPSPVGTLAFALITEDDDKRASEDDEGALALQTEVAEILAALAPRPGPRSSRR